MISPGQTARYGLLFALLAAAAACGAGPDADPTETAIISPPAECSPPRPDCSSSLDFPVASDLTVDNSAGIRFSPETGALVIDRVNALPDIDGDGVPDDADDCPGTPDWITCDDDPTNDGVYATVFYDPSGANEVVRSATVTTTSEIPQIDVYFLIDANAPSFDDEIDVLKAEILTIIDDVRLEFEDAHFGLGLYRQYPLAAPLADPHSQSPYHHILDLTDDEALVDLAFSTLNTVGNTTMGTAATQALYSIASGSGLGDMVANRAQCPNAEDVGYPCFRPDALHVVMNITDSRVYNGPQFGGLQYGNPPFDGVVGGASMDLPPVEMFPGILLADTAALALDLGDLSARSLTLLGMSTSLNDQVFNTATAPGCETPPDGLPGNDMDSKDVVLTFRFDSLIAGATAFSDNTHWPGAYVALFDDTLLDPATAIACDNGTVGNGSWGAIAWTPTIAQQYYLVVDGIVPETEPGHAAEGAFSIAIVHDGDPANPTWTTTDAPVAWNDVETALLASDIRVASVTTLPNPMAMSSDANLDARLIAQATRARTKSGGQWVTELPSSTGEGLDAAVSNTIKLASSDSVYDISLTEVDNDATMFDERDFVLSVRWDDCADEAPLGCGWGSQHRCRRCDVGAIVDFEVLFMNSSVPPTTMSQVFDFELVVRADNDVEIERIPVRVMIPDAPSHEFDATPDAAFYRNAYDTTTRCNTPPEHPKWGDLVWDGTTPAGTSIEFQIRTAPTLGGLATAVPAIVEVPADTASDTLDITEELIADGQVYGLPYIQITAFLNPSTSPPATPTLEGWSFEFVCEAAE